VIGDIMGGLVAEHVVSRSVRDTAAVLDGKAASEAAAKLCEKLGHHVEEGRPPLPADDEANFRTNFITIWATGLAMLVKFFGKTLGKTPAREDFEGLTWASTNSAKPLRRRNTNVAGRACRLAHDKSRDGNSPTTPGSRLCLDDRHWKLVRSTSTRLTS
jgi:hypothetical protein